MEKETKSFRCEITTPQGVVESVETCSVVFPAKDGLVGILPDRSPLVSNIGDGPLTIETMDHKHHEYFIAGGFARMDENVLTILAEQCCLVSKLDGDAVWDEIQRARKLPAETESQSALRDQTIQTARTKFQLVQRRKKRLREKWEAKGSSPETTKNK